MAAPASEASSSSTPYQVAAVTSQFMSGTFQPTQVIPQIHSLSDMQIPPSSTQSPAFPSVVIPTASTDSTLPSIFSSPDPHSPTQPCSSPPSHSLCSPPIHISPQHNIVPPVPPIRQSTIAHKLPAYLQNYQCNNASFDPVSLSTVVQGNSSTNFPLSQVLSYSNLSPNYKSFVFNASTIREPSTYNEASKSPLLASRF